MNAAFASGAGIDPGTLKYFVSALVAAAALLWSSWVVMGLLAQWHAGTIEFLGLVTGTVRATILVMLLIYFIN